MKNRREFIVELTMAAAAISYLRPLQALAGMVSTDALLPGFNKLTILHSSNLYGQLTPLGVNDKLVGLGGLENLGRKIKAIRDNRSAVLLIDSGNMAPGAALSQGRALQFYNRLTKLGYDAVVPGKTDLVAGIKPFARMAQESRLRVIGGTGGSGQQGLLPYTILNKGNIEVALIDAGGRALKDIKATASNPIAALNATACRLKEAGACRLTICILQEDMPNCLRYAALSSGIDVMISSIGKTTIHNTRIVRNREDEEVILSHAGTRGTMLGQIDITFNERFEKVNIRPGAVLVGAKDEDYAQLLRKYRLYGV